MFKLASACILIKHICSNSAILSLGLIKTFNLRDFDKLMTYGRISEMEKAFCDVKLEGEQI